MYEECDKRTLSQEQPRKVVKTRWVAGDRPDPSTTTTTGVQPASELRARFVAKGYSQHVNDPMVDCYAATPSTTSLKTLLLLGINTTRSPNYLPRHLYSFHQHATTRDRRDLRTTTTRMVLRLTYYCLAVEEGHVWTTYESETMATTPWKSTTTTWTTTVQG